MTIAMHYIGFVHTPIGETLSVGVMLNTVKCSPGIVCVPLLGGMLRSVLLLWVPRFPDKALLYLQRHPIIASVMG